MSGIRSSNLFLFVIFVLSSSLWTGILGAVITHSTPIGIYRGERLNVDWITVDRFLGIRYGQIGERFGRPKPSWLLSGKDDKHNARNWPISCVQQPGFMGEWMNNPKTDEDCLFLNVWRPQTDAPENTDQLSAELLPVFVFFHGGSFISDSISKKTLDATQLAARMNAVVVTVNYRLDALGFFYAQDSSKGQSSNFTFPQGNQAIWDQILALEWVQDNIAFFGGNPKRVTIAGHNSGATSVGIHLLSPLSRTLFQKAILQSGSLFNQMVVLTQDSSTKVSQMWSNAATKIECLEAGKDWSEKAVECLKKAPVEKILKLLDPLAKESTSPQIILGDEILPYKNILEAIEDLKDSLHEIDVLVGSTNDEGGVILPILDMNIYSMIMPKNMKIEDARKELEKYSELLVPPIGSKISKIDGSDVARQYFSDMKIDETKSKDGDGALQNRIGVALGDFYVTCPMREFSRRLLRTGKVNLYQYVWSIKVPIEFSPCAEWMGACSGTDAGMLFGAPFLDNKVPQKMKDISEKFIKTVKKFVYFG